MPHPSEPQQPPPTKFLITLSVAATCSLFGQAAAPNPPAKPPAADDIIELSPFTVDASADKGYRAANTLAGSRLNTSLNDTPASVTVFTKELLEDLGLNQLEQLSAYIPSTQMNLQDTSAAPNANNYLGGPNLVKNIDVRGIGASQGLDFFKSITVDDSYRIDRYDQSRGPNSILFGVGGAGGMINQTSMLASTQRNSGRVSYQFGNNNSEANRTEFRFNRVVVPKKIGLAVAAVHQENAGWRKPSYQDKDRLFATVTITPTEKITIRAMGERGHENSSVIAPFGAFDGGLAWLDNRNALGAGAVTFAPTTAAPTAAQIALGVATRNGTASATTDRYVFVAGSGTLFDSAGTYLTASYNNPAVRGPNGAVGVTGATLAINDPKFLPYAINSGGPGMFRDTWLTNYTVTADWAVTSRLNINVGYNFQDVHFFNPVIKGTQPLISGDPNRTLGVNGPVNPNVGQLYIESPWFGDLHSGNVKESRLSLSYDLDSQRWPWLGRHRLAGLYSRTDQFDRYYQRQFGFLGAPFNATPTNANNLLTERVYLNESNPGSFVAPDWRSVPSTLTIGGVSRPVGWIDSAAGTGNSDAEQKMNAKLIVGQSRFFKDRLITTIGYRVDQGNATSFGFTTDPVLKTPVATHDPALATVNSLKGITRTQGVVLHATDWLSLLANNSTNIGIPTFTDKVFPNGTIADPSKGKGHDYGLSLDLLSNRLSLKLVKYTTSQQGQTKSGGINAQYNLRNIAIASAFQSVLVGPGLPYTAATWAPVSAAMTPPVGADEFDQDSKGYEVSAVANLTRNWRLMANYSDTNRIRSNTSGHDAIPWYGFTYDGKLVKQGVTQNANGTYTINPSAFTSTGTVAQWIALGNKLPAANVNTLITSDAIPVAAEIMNMINDINNDKLTNEQGWGSRPRKVSLFTAYDFTDGRIKGFTVGGGYRWSSSNLAGFDSSGNQIRGRALSAADLLLRYRIRMPGGWLQNPVSFQFNATNLLNQHGIIPQRLAATPVTASPTFVVPGGRGIGYSRFDLMEPRSIRFTTTYSF